jgi:hypothetical protein
VLHNIMIFDESNYSVNSGKNNKFKKTIALLFMLMYNYTANEIKKHSLTKSYE